MGDVYRFIDAKCKVLGCPPFPIPHVEFVPVALAVANDTNDVYLIEDPIEGEFVKYINNGSAQPCSFPYDPSSEHIAEFLTFAQHVQFWRTGENAFVSDFQGI